MPRTKAPKTLRKKPVDKLDDLTTFVNVIIKDAHAVFQKEIEDLEARKSVLLKKVDDQMLFMNLQISTTYQDMTIKQLMKHSVTSTIMKTACDNLEYSSVNSANKSKKSQKNKRSLSCTPDDDGYLTGDSASSRGTRASRLRTRAPLANSTTRASRSLSRSLARQEVPLNLNTKKHGYKTPNGKQPSKAYGMITPKMQPNTPQLILRRPKLGEVAVSLEGSPLMVNPVAADQIANVNIPLGEGRLLSLQPERGLRMSQLPLIDAETQRQLLTLGEHIQKICAASNRL